MGVKVWRWLVEDWCWPGAAGFAAALLVLLVPVAARGWPLAWVLVFCQLPSYLVHQWEEHQGDRFRKYVNDRLGGGRQLLTRPMTFWINFWGVWVLLLTSLYGVAFVGPAAGLLAGYLSLGNGVVHAVQAAKLWEYNPGLMTACVLLLPGGAACVAVTGGSLGFSVHAMCAGLIVGLHAVIVAIAGARYRRLLPP